MTVLACPLPTAATDDPWPVAGRFVDALSRRDFVALGTCLAPDVRFRALVPRGPLDLTGADAVVERFTAWFGSKTEFVLLDASVGNVGPRTYLRWRAWTRTDGEPTACVVEQHAFATARSRIESLDLLCSGFQTDPHPGG